MAKRAKQKHIENPEQVARIMDAQRQRTLVREKLYPALVDATVSVDEAKMLLQSINSLIMEDALQVLRDKKVGDLKAKLIKKLCADGREKEVSALLDTIDSETLFTAKALIEGLSSAIEHMIRAEMMDRTLNSFTPDWDKILAR